jgi:hypothetical protein
MYATCTFVVGDVTHIGAMTSFARVSVWTAGAVWLVVVLAIVSKRTGGSA